MAVATEATARRNGTPGVCELGVTDMGDAVDRHIGRRILLRRRSLGLTQKQLADAVGVRFQQIQKYECGANRISASRIWALAQVLDVPVGYFYDDLIAG